jgi:hypothetical protein
VSALLNNLASIFQQLQAKPTGKNPAAPIPGTPGYRPPLNRPRGTLLTGQDVPIQPRKTLLGT